MCELFCLSSAEPTTVSFSLAQLAAHGALGQANVDGWGLSFYDGRDMRLYKEPEPAGESAWLTYILDRNLTCSRAVSHIRRASQGALTHANTQPYARELAGRMHVFAHNGDLHGLEGLRGRGPHRFTPVGQTDSELAFCILLERLAPLWAHGAEPRLKDRLAVVEQFARDARTLGQANFFYCDGDHLFGHSHRRGGLDAHGGLQPGLWRLERACAVEADALPDHGLRIGPHRHGQHIAMLASVPLTDEDWKPLAEGEVLILKNGHVATVETL